MLYSWRRSGVWSLFWMCLKHAFRTWRISCQTSALRTFLSNYERCDKPGSVFCYFSRNTRRSIIYLITKSPWCLSVLPSIVWWNQLGEQPLMTMVYSNLQPPADTAHRSPCGWWSLTPPSHPYLYAEAVILFCLNLLSPIACNFASGVLCAARTFLSHSWMPAIELEHCRPVSLFVVIWLYFYSSSSGSFV